MSKQTFRNRRGHKVSINEAVNEIETQKVPSKATKPLTKNIPAKVTTKKRSSKNNPFKFPRIRLSKKVLSIIIAILLLAAFGLLVVADGIKRDYERQAAAMQRDVTTLSSAPSSRDSPAVDIARDLRESLNQSSDCRVAIELHAWYGPAAETKQLCESVAQDYKLLRTNLETMEQNATYTAAVGDSLRAALQNPSSGTFASITEYSDRWDDAAERLASVDSPSDINELHEELLEQVQSIRDGWNDLRQANADQDRSAFETAEKALTKNYKEIRPSYRELSSINQSIQEEINRLTTKLTIE